MSRAKLGPLPPLWYFWPFQNGCLLLPQDPGHQHLQLNVPFARGSGQAQGLSLLKLREPEPEKRHGGHFGIGPPHSPKFKVGIPLTSIPVLTASAMVALETAKSGNSVKGARAGRREKAQLYAEATRKQISMWPMCWTPRD